VATLQDLYAYLRHTCQHKRERRLPIHVFAHRLRRRPQRWSASSAALIERILDHYWRGQGFAHYNLVPLRELPPDRQALSPAYLEQARLLDLIATILVAMQSATSGENPTLGLLQYLIERGVVTDTALIADVLSSDALMLGRERYVTGLGWVRFGIVRTETGMPLFLPPAVRSPELRPVPGFVRGLGEHHWLYFRAAPGEYLDMIPAYRIDLRAACALTGWEASTIYAKLSGNRRDFDLVEARLQTSDTARQVVFNPDSFWRWLFKRRKK
jgi:hypothetical protein